MAFAMTPATALNPWLQILAALEKKVNRSSFETWLKPTRYSHAAGRTLYVRVPSPEFQHIGDKWGDLIQEAIDLQSLEFDDVFFRDCGRRSVDSSASQGRRFRPGFDALSVRSAANPARAPQQIQIDWSTAAQLNSRYTFDNFVIGNGNQFARAAALCGGRAALAGAYNPPFSVWRCRDGQDAPDARHRARRQTTPAHDEYLLRFRREIYQRNDHLAAQRSHDEFSRSVSAPWICC